MPFKIDCEGLPNVESLLCTMLEGGREKCGAHANAGGLPGAELKRIANHLGIPTAQSKGNLIECIFTKSENIKKLNNEIDDEAVHLYGTPFKKNKNTFPRLSIWRSSSCVKIVELQNRL